MDLSVQRAYSLLVEDYLKICEFIEPADRNLDAYSHRIYELFLRVCTEFESVSKNILISYQYAKAISKPDELSIIDYNNLYSDSSMLGSRLSANVGLLYWNGGVKFVRPFGDWVSNSPLAWYRAYNEVKHSRETNFDKASFENLTLALSGVFLLLNAKNGWAFFQPYSKLKSSGSAPGGGQTCQGSVFSIR